MFATSIAMLNYKAMLGKTENARKRAQALLAAVKNGVEEQVEEVESLQKKIDADQRPHKDQLRGF